MGNAGRILDLGKINIRADPARKDRGHAACNQLALNRGIPSGTRDLARRNLFFYAQPISTMTPSFAAHRIDFRAPDGFYAMNPSIARLGEQIVTMVRCVNYKLADGRYETPGGAPITTRNFLLGLTVDLAIQSIAEVLPPSDFPPPAYPWVIGFEDPRLFAWNNELWCCSNVRERTPEGWCEQIWARIDDSAPDVCRLTAWRPLYPEGPRLHEKNWMPFVEACTKATGADALRFVYLCDPTRILDDQARTVAKTIPTIAAENFRGGSQAIAFDGGWLALIHEDVSRDGQRFYHHRFVWLDAAYTLRRVSRRFYLNQNGIEFAAGLAWHPDGQRLMVSYGVGDCESWLGAVNADEVRSTLDEVALSQDNSAPAPSFSEQAAMPSAEPTQRQKISGFVISYNRADVIETCLRSLGFVDELIVVDKSSDDGTVDIARRYADKVAVVPWSPVVEDTRDYALSLCSHDFIVFLDDDECLSPDAIKIHPTRGRQPDRGCLSLSGAQLHFRTL